MRLRTVRNPLAARDGPFKHLRCFIVIIWTLSITPRLVFFPLILLNMDNQFIYFGHVIFHIFNTIPTIGIVLMYGLLARSVAISKQKNQEALSQSGVTTQQRDDTRMTSIVVRLVVMLLICYLPFLVNKSYMNIKILTQKSYQLGDSKSNITKTVDTK